MADLQDLLTCKAELDNKINKLEVELSALREKVSFFNVIYSKFDETLAKVQEMIENRRNETNDDLRDVYKKIQDTEDKLINEMQNLRAEMKQQHEVERRKIDDLNRWRWIVMGGAAVVGFLLSKAADLVK